MRSCLIYSKEWNENSNKSACHALAQIMTSSQNRGNAWYIDDHDDDNYHDNDDYGNNDDDALNHGDEGDSIVQEVLALPYFF